MKFHEKLYSLRKSKDLSQDELAEKLGISRQAVSRWEMGTAEPSAQNLIEIGKLFGVSIDYLLKDDAEKESCESAPESEKAKSHPFPANPKPRYDILFIVSVVLTVCHALQVLYSLPVTLFSVSIPFAIALWSVSCVFHAVNIVIFELVYRHYKHEPNAKAHRRRYYRISVWFFAFTPSLVLASLISFGLFPVNIIFLTFPLYFIVCLCVTLILRKEKQNKCNLNKENS